MEAFFEVYSLENKHRAVSWGEKYSVHSVACLTQTAIDSALRMTSPFRPSPSKDFDLILEKRTRNIFCPAEWQQKISKSWSGDV